MVVVHALGGSQGLWFIGGLWYLLSVFIVINSNLCNNFGSDYSQHLIDETQKDEDNILKATQRVMIWT